MAASNNLALVSAWADVLYEAICKDVEEKPTVKGAAAFRDCVLEQCTDKAVVLPACRIGPQACSALLKLLKAKDSANVATFAVRRLDLSHNALSDEGVIPLSQLIRALPGLKQLCLQNNAIGNEGVVELSKTLASNSSLQILDLSSVDHLANLNINSSGGPNSAAAAGSSSAIGLGGSSSAAGNVPSVSGATGGSNVSPALNASNTANMVASKRNNIEAKSATQLAAALTANRSLSALSLKGNPLGKGSPAAFAKLLETLAFLLQRNKALTYLDLENTSLGSKGCSALCAAAASNRSLRTLSLARNGAGPDAGKAVQSLLSENESLIALHLEGNNLGRSFAAVCSALCWSAPPTFPRPAGSIDGNCSLIILDVAGNDVGDDGAEALAEALSTNRTLTSVNVARNNITEKGALAIARALSGNAVLSSLNLSSNSIKNPPVVALAECMVTNGSLISLDLCSCKITDDAAVALVTAVGHNERAALRKLRLRDNYISAGAGELMADALYRNKSLTVADLRGNQIDHVRLTKIKAMCQRNLSELRQAEPRRLRKEIARLKGEQVKLRRAERTLRQQQQQIDATKQKIANIQQEQAEFMRGQQRRRAEIQSQIDAEQASIDQARSKLEEKRRELATSEQSYAARIADLQETLNKETEARKAVEKDLAKV